MIWLDIPGFPGYKASLDGQIMSLKGLSFEDPEPKILKQTPGDQGYLVVGLRQGNKTVVRKVHTFIALAFHGPCPEGKEVCHNDGNKLNNRAGNLRYDTSGSNNFDQVAHGTHYEANRDCCDQGHEFTPENTGWRWDKKGKKGGRKVRRCKECHRIAIAKQRAKDPEKARRQAAEYAREWRAKKKAERNLQQS